MKGNYCKKNDSTLQPKKTLDDWIKEAAMCDLDYGNYRALIESGHTFKELMALNYRRGAGAHSKVHCRQR